MDREQARKVLFGMNLGFGIAFLLFPKLSMRIYGLDPEANATAAYPLRYLGARSLVFAALLADEEGSDALTGQVPLITAVDATANFFALLTGEVPRRVAILGSLTVAAVTAVGLSAQD